ncbi:MAG: IS21 family transposase [Pseudomonadota bacterium]
MQGGLGHRAAALRFGIDRGTVAKTIAHPTPPGYQRKVPVRRPKLADHETFIEQILDDDENAPRKHRHTAQRIFERLRDERGVDCGYSTVPDYVRSRRQVRKEVFVPLAHSPGHAQADFGEATVVLGGVERKVRFFVMDLPQSDAVFIKAYHADTAEAFCDGHVEAFDFFGGVPLSILSDNTRLAVAQILSDGTSKRSHAFAALQCHHVFEDRFGRPARGNDKGGVEGMVGFTRRTFMVPVPHVRDIE